MIPAENRRPSKLSPSALSSRLALSRARADLTAVSEKDAAILRSDAARFSRREYETLGPSRIVTSRARGFSAGVSIRRVSFSPGFVRATQLAR